MPNWFTGHNIEIEDPPFAKFIFGNTAFSWVGHQSGFGSGWQWLSAGWGKVNNPAWVVTGEALKGYWTKAVEAAPADWFSNFLQFLLNSGSYTWFAKLIAFGETAVGIALILGAFVGIAAFFGAFIIGII